MLKNYFDNVLIAGSGPVGVNLYINFNKGYAEKVGLKIRNSKNSELFFGREIWLFYMHYYKLLAFYQFLHKL